MPSRVKLCAIAQNEGAYLADWVFHHLRAGFDAIEVWINGSQDTSVEIMRAVGAAHQQVTFRVVDDLLEDSLRRGKYFQYRAYAKLGRKAAREGFTHAAFLDLDEYWLTSDLTGTIHDFLPDDPDVNVVSFPWCYDVPDPARAAFTHAVQGAIDVQPDPHVKSVVRLDDRITQFRPHTARTVSGTRLLVRDPFPLVDEQQQQWGSLVPADHVATYHQRPPVAFVLHAVNRSQTEYVASLRKAFRTSPTDSEFRDNRTGYVARGGPVLRVNLPPGRVADYAEGLAEFRRLVGVDAPVREARSRTRQRADSVVDALVADPPLMERLRGALAGVSAPALDRRYPGWDHALSWWVDEVAAVGGALVVTGWAFTTAPGGNLEFGVRDAAGASRRPDAVDRVPRPDVVQAHPDAPADSGFRLTFAGLADTAGTTEGAARLLARPAGTEVWSSTPLPRWTY